MGHGLPAARRSRRWRRLPARTGCACTWTARASPTPSPTSAARRPRRPGGPASTCCRFGATKNGALAAEAVVFFDPQLAAGFERAASAPATSPPRCASSAPSCRHARGRALAAPRRARQRHGRPAGRGPPALPGLAAGAAGRGQRGVRGHARAADRGAPSRRLRLPPLVSRRPGSARPWCVWSRLRDRRRPTSTALLQAAGSIAG